MSPWGWLPERSPGIWRHGAVCLRPIVVASPFVSVILLLMLLHFVSGKLTAAEGMLFELPEVAPTDVVSESPVALVMTVRRETLVFFDDTRYLLSDSSSERAFAEQVRERFSHSSGKTLLLLSDRRVAGGDLLRVASLARASGVERVFIAEQRPRGTE